MLLQLLTSANDFLWNRVVLWFLLGAGGFFTIYLGFVQIRFFGQSIGALFLNKSSDKKQISSFQALCTSLAQRVGTGNLAGVATALTYGGEGAIFWMWMTALVGASTAFAESTLAQVFKVKKADGTFFGGPAYYIHAGLKSKGLAIIFSLSLITALGFVFNAVQSNTIAQGLSAGFALNPLDCGLVLSVIVAIIIMGGKKRIAQVAEIIVPLMALSYLCITIYVLATNFEQVPQILSGIFNAAFSPKAAVAGVLGHTVNEAFRYGVARGLFSNEAGWGSAPNAAATAAVSHPVQQGLVQMVAVYIDTLLICTSTAVIILLARDLDPNLTGIALTQAAAEFHFGFSGKIFIGLAIFFFGFTTILGNTFYGEANVQFISKKPFWVKIYRLLVLLMVILGSVLQVPTVWQMADFMSAVMTIINLSSICLLAHIIKKTTDHYSNNFLKNEPFNLKQIGITPTGYNFAFDEQNNQSRLT
jgi:AGCS family alanine or glycine:cation symporter